MRPRTAAVSAPLVRRKALDTRLAWIISIAVSLVFLAPLLWMLMASLRTESRIFSNHSSDWLTTADWTLSNYADAWRRSALGRAIFNSSLQVLLTASGGLLVNSMAAYAFARLTFPGRDALFAAVVILIILPVEVLAVPMFFTARDLGLTGDFSAAMAGLTIPFLAKAFNIYFLRAHFMSLPRTLEEAAAIDGAGTWKQFWSVALPAIRPALATVILLDLLAHWGDFLWPLMIATRAETRTVQIGLANLFTQPPIQWGDILACSVIITLPVLAFFRFFQRYVVISDPNTGIK